MHLCSTFFISTTLVIFLLSVHQSCSVKFQITPPLKSFHGRLEYLAQLHISIQKSLSPHKSKISSHSTSHHDIKFVTGPLNIGKTQIVRKYVDKYGHTFDHVICLNGADGPHSLFSSFLNLASSQSLLHLFDQEKAHKIRQDIRQSLRNGSGTTTMLKNIVQKIYSHILKDQSTTLLIFEDATVQNESEDFLHNFLPQISPPSIQPVILVTSEKLDSRWGGLCDEIELFPLSGWTTEEQVEYILENIGFLNDFEKDEEAGKDAKELGKLLRGIPLAIQLTAAYLKETRMEMKDYIRIYNSTDPEPRKDQKEEEKDPVSVAWFLTRHELEETDEGSFAILIMEIMASLSKCEDTPTVILKRLFIDRIKSSHQITDGSNWFSYALSILESFQLIQRTKVKDDEIIYCQKAVVNLVKINMPLSQREELERNVMESMENLLTQIVENNTDLVGNPLEFLERFVVTQRSMGDGRDVEKNEKFLNFVLKLALLYEKIGDEGKVDFFIHIFMGKVKEELAGECENEGKEWTTKIFDYLSNITLSHGLTRQIVEEKVENRTEKANPGEMDQDPEIDIFTNVPKLVMKEMKKNSPGKMIESTAMAMRNFVEKLAKSSKEDFGELHFVTVKLRKILVRIYEGETDYEKAMRTLREICPENNRDPTVGRDDEGQRQVEHKRFCKDKMAVLNYEIIANTIGDTKNVVQIDRQIEEDGGEWTQIENLEGDGELDDKTGKYKNRHYGVKYEL